MDNWERDSEVVAVDTWAVEYRAGYKHWVCVVDWDWPGTVFGLVVVARREDADERAVPYTEYQVLAVPASRGDDDTAWPCAMVVAVPAPCVPFADMQAVPGKAPGMADVTGPAPIMAAPSPRPLASEMLYQARDVVRSLELYEIQYRIGYIYKATCKRN